MKDVLHIYCRVSSGIQEKGNSLEEQEQSGIRLSKQLGFNHMTWNEEKVKHQNLILFTIVHKC